MEITELALWLYGRSRRATRAAAIKMALNAEGGEFRSSTLREIFRRYHGVEVGMYSHGGCFVPHQFGRGTTIGRYCSIARTAFAATLNHPMDHKSMHGFFFNPNLGYTDEKREYSPLVIGSDVWLGQYSIIQPGVGSIGHGAVVGAGAVVSKDVPPYAVVVGNPGRVVRFRFSPETIAALLAEQWWTKDIDELTCDIDAFTRPWEAATSSSAVGESL